MNFFKMWAQKVRIVLGVCVLSGLFSVELLAQPYSGLLTVGGAGSPDFATLTQAFTAISASSLSGPVILELQSGYNSSGETFPLSVPANATSTNTLTIRPGVSGLTILNTTATATFALTGSSWCILDGRVGGSGSTKDLVVESSDVAGQAISLSNDASNNVFRYCIFKGASNNGSSGVVVVGNGIVTGCDNNRIEYCDICESASTPRNGIYSLGISGADNSGNTVSNCNIYNFYHSSLDMAGILLGAFNYGWLIENCSFYQTSARNTSGTIMAIQSSSTNTAHLRINNNYVGGSAPECGGSPMTITGTGVIRGIRLTVGNDPSSVQGNTIQNISFTSSSTSTAISGIHLVTGSVNCGDTIPNLVGSLTTPNSIVFTLSGTGPVVSGILAGLGTPGTIRILNNKIGGLTATGSGTINFQGIYVQTAATGYTITGNTIGSALAPLTNTTNNKTIGIYSTSPAADQVITGNIVQNLVNTSATTASQLIGISTPGNSGGNFSIRNNIVRNLSSASTSSSGATSSALIGIMVNATTLTSIGHAIENNLVYGLYNSAPTQGVNVVGILYAGPSSGNYYVSGNAIHSFSTLSTSNSAGQYGIYFTNGNATGGSLRVFNNMIRLGLDTLGNAITTTPIIAGIRKSATPGNMAMMHNNIYIGGNGVASGTANTMCYWRSTGTPTADSAYNNIFVNARSNSGSGGKHFGCVWNSTTAVRNDYNIYYCPGSGGVLASVNGGTADLLSIGDIQAALSGYEISSLNTNPLYNAPEGTSTTLDLHLQNSTPAEGVGIPIPYVTVDFDNETRSSLTPTDIGADAANFVNTSMSGNYTIGTGGDFLNLTGNTGFFNAVNSNLVSGNITATIISNLAEPGTIALNEWTEPGVPVFTLTIQSDGVSQRIIANTGDLSSPMIRLNGADRVSFNGGSGNNLRFINEHSIPGSTQAVFYTDNGATSVSITNCLIQSNATNPVNAAVVIGNTGTNVLNLTGNSISDIPSMGSPATAVYSNSLTNSLTLTNNSIFNFRNFGLNLPQVAPGLSITGNSFYNNLSSSATADQTAIYIGSNGNHGISNNYIGGSSAGATGNWINTGLSDFVGIELALSGSTMSIVDGNVIRNISLTHPGATTFKGIHLFSGPALIGFPIGTGNTIGDTLNANSLVFNGIGSYYAIHEETASTSSSIEKNQIANIVLSAASGTPVFYAIKMNVADVVRNRIMKITASQAGLTPLIYGIFNGCTDNSAAIGIQNNMISISGGASVNPEIYGYFDQAISGSTIRVYFNSISIHGSATGGSFTYALFRDGDCNFYLQNNILSNKRAAGGGGFHYAVYAVNSFNWTSDYNNYFSSTGPLGFWMGLNRTDLSAWVTASSEDPHSVGNAPSFMDVENLHLINTTNCYLNGKGISIGGITTDYDNETRSATPDMGADEFSPLIPPAPSSWENKSVCYGLSIPALTASGSGTIRWYSDITLTNLVNTGTSYNTGQTAVGTYTYYVVNEVNGCQSNIVTVTLTIYPLPLASAGAVAANVCQGNTIQLNGTASGGSGTGYNYQWNGPAAYSSLLQNPAISNAQPAQSGSYTLLVRDSRNCISDPGSAITITVTAPPLAGASAVQTSVCAGSSLQLNGSATGGAGGPFTYNWSGPSGFTSSLQNPVINPALATHAGTYLLTVTDANLCNSSTAGQVSITIVPLPVADAGVNQTIPNGTSTTLTANVSGGSGNYAYAWEPAAYIAGNNTLQTIQTMNLAVTRTFTLTVTDLTTGCISQPDNVTVTITGLPLSASASAGSSQLCLGTGTQLFVNASGGSGSYTYQWSSNPSGFTSSSQNPAINPTTTTTYTVTVNDGFSTVQSSATVTIFSLPVAGASAVASSLCSGATLQLNGIALGGSGSGFVYSWSGPGGWTSSAQNPAIPAVQTTNSGSYSLLVSDDRGCQSFVPSTVNILVNARPVAVAGASSGTACAGGSITLSGSATSGSGSYSYQWTGPGGYTSGTQNPVLSNIQSAQAGVYSLVVNDLNGCASVNSASVTIGVNSLPVAGAGSASAVICAGQAVQLNAVASGGSGGGYSYAWTGPGGFSSTQQFPVISGATPANSGTYTLVVTDANNCASTASSTGVTVHALPVANAGIDKTIPNGTSTNLSGSGFGGSSNYSWSWTPSAKINGNSFQQNIQTAILTATQIYELVIHDNVTGCNSNPDAVTVFISGLSLGVYAEASDEEVCQGDQVTLNATAFGGSGSYSYSWSSNPAGFTSTSQSPVITAATTTTYSVTVNDGFTTVSSSVTVTVHAKPTAVANAVQTSLCTGESLLLTGSATGGGGSGYNFNWTGPNAYTSNLQNPVLSNIQQLYSGSFQLTVTDLYGCQSAMSAVAIVVHAKPSVTAGVLDAGICAGENISLTALATGGSGSGYSFSWTGPSGFTSTMQNPLISNAQTTQQGTYTVSVTDDHSCTSAGSGVSVAIVSLPVANAGLDQTIPHGTNTTLLATASGGSGNYQYQWTPQSYINGNSAVNLIQTSLLTQQQTYSVIVTDITTSCVSLADQVTVFVSGGPLSVSISATATEVCAGTAVLLTATASGGSGSYTYSWTSNPAGFSSTLSSFAVTPSISTTYILVVNDGFSSASNSRSITVNALPGVTLPASLGERCINGSSIVLSGGLPAGGTYLGTGVSNGVFTPTVAGAGNHTVTYRVQDAHGCSATALSTVSVYSLPIVSFDNSLSPLCADAPINLLSGGTPAGGTYSGTGVTDNAFNPVTAGVGTHILTYSYIDIHGCQALDQNTQVVNPVPVVVFTNPIPAQCVNASPYTLSGGTPAGGTYSGSGVASGSFNPATAGVGIHEVIYQYRNTFNCESKDTNTIQVQELPLVYGVSGGGGYCIGEPGLSVLLSGSQVNTSYQLYKNGSAVGTPVMGTGSGLTWSSLNSGTYTVKATNQTTLCQTEMAGQAVITQTTLPALYSVSGSGSYCFGSNGLTITLSGSEAGVLYQLFKNGIAVGTAVTGTGATLTWANQSSGTYTVEATSACSRTMNGSATIIEDPEMVVSVTPDPAYVVVNLSISLNASATGGTGFFTSYNWSDSGAGFLNSASNQNPVFSCNTVGNYPLQLMVTDNHGCTGTTDFIVHVTSIVAEPLMDNQEICGTGSAVMLATITAGADRVEFSLDGLTPVFVDNSAPFEYTTPVIPVNTDLIVYARSVNSTSGLMSTWIPATASAIQGSDAGFITGGPNQACILYGTGPLTVNEYKGNIIRWQKRLNGGNWLNINSTSEVYSENPFAAGTWDYRVVVKLNDCPEDYSDPFTIVFFGISNPGQLTGTEVSICQGESVGTLTVAGNNGSVINWERRFNAGPWVVVGVGGNTFTDTPAQPGNWAYRVMVVNGDCPVDYTNTWTVGVAASPTGGSLSGSGQICAGSYTPTMILSGYSGSIVKWQRKFNTGAWVDFVNTGTWFEEILVNPGTYSYRVVLSGYNCPDAYSGIATVTVLSPASAGMVNGSANICLGNSTGFLTLGSYSGTIIRWQKKYGNGSWTDLNHFTATYQETPTAPGTWYYRVVVQVGVCGQVYSNPAVIGVSAPAVGGTIAGSTVICVGNSTGILNLTGYTGSIQKWQRRLNSGSWTDIPNSTSTYSEALNQSGSYEYRAVVQNGGCPAVYSGSAMVQVTPLTVAGVTTGSGSLCYGEQGPVITLSGHSGTILGWQKRLNGGAWSDVINTNATYQETPAAPGSWEYRAVLQNGNCNIAYSAITTVTVNPLPQIQVVSGNPILCANAAGAVLTLSGSQTGVGYQLFKNGIASGFPAQGTGQSIQWTGLQPGMYTVTATGTATFCVSEMQGELEVQAYPVPVAEVVSASGYDCGNLGSGVVLLSGSEPGVSYQLLQNMNPTGLPLVGTGAEMEWNSLFAGNYKIQATYQLSGCQNMMTGTAQVISAPLPQTFTVTGGGTACQNTAGMPVNLSGSQSGIIYTLFMNSDITSIQQTGSGAALSFGQQTTSGVYTVNGTNQSTGCRVMMNGQAVISILPAPVVDMGPDIDLLYGGSVILSPQVSPGLEPYTYLWTPSTALSSVSILNPIASPEDSISYTLKVTGNNNCFTTDQIAVKPFLPDGQSVISGRVTYGNTQSTPLHDIPVFLKNASGLVVAQGYTNANGEYKFQPFPNGTYTLSAASDQAVGGINSTDALRILKQFVQIQPITGVWLAAADVDATGYVNSIDALAVQLYFVGSVSGFPAGKWVFEKHTIQFTGGIFYQDFKGVCYGDVNGSYIPYAKSESALPVLTKGTLTASPDEVTQIPVWLSEELTLGALSLQINYDPEQLEVLDATMPGTQQAFVQNKEQGSIRLSWANTESLFVNPETPAFYLSARIRQSDAAFTASGELSDPWASPISDISLHMPKVNLSSFTRLPSVEAWPNPCSSDLNLRLYLSEAGNTAIEIFDLQGRLLRLVQQQEMPAGTHTLKINTLDLPNGVYIGKMTTSHSNPVEFKIEIIH